MLTHEGYMDGLCGKDPVSNHEEYEAGWLVGAEDREAGVEPGLYETCDLKRGDIVEVPKGTKLLINMSPKKSSVVGRTCKVVLHDVYQTQVAHVVYASGEVRRPKPPTVVWAGAGGYWKHACAWDVKR
jgi:hypothetical protein